MNYVTFFGTSPMFLWSQVPTQDAPQPPSHLFNGPLEKQAANIYG